VSAPILLIVPSRGRPAAAAELLEAVWATTKASWTTQVDVMFGLDDDDPTLYRYPKRGVTSVGPRVGMNGTLNRLATAWAHHYEVIGFCGDDHRPRTAGWPGVILDEVRAAPHRIVYPDDLLQGENLATSVFMASSVIRACGWMAPPTLKHLYLDNAWLELGRALGSLKYLPDVVFEHMHPSVGKGTWDKGYLEVNSPQMFDEDRAAFEAWRDEGGLTEAVDRVLAGGPQ